MSDSDQAKLAELQYEPSDKIVESLEENDWKSASFSVIGRKRFLAAHRQFRKDMKTSCLLCVFVTIIVFSCYLAAFVLIRTISICKYLHLVAVSVVTKYNQHP